MKLIKIPFNKENEEYVCIKCKDTPQDFIPVCDKHENGGMMDELKECRDCHICDRCKPRKYLERILKEEPVTNSSTDSKDKK